MKEFHIWTNVTILSGLEAVYIFSFELRSRSSPQRTLAEAKHSIYFSLNIYMHFKEKTLVGHSKERNFSIPSVDASLYMKVHVLPFDHELYL